MKILTGLALAGFLLASHASATPFTYVQSLCGTFSNPLPNTPVSGSFVCPTAASLGVGGGQTVGAEFLVWNSDYSNGVTPTVTDVTSYSITNGPTFQFASDNLTSTGTSLSTAAVCSSGATFNALTTAFGPTVLAGCYNNATGGTLGNGTTVGFGNSFTTGNALQGSGYVQIVYGYTVTAAVPEPASLLLVGGGLIALFAFRRKVFGAN